MLPIKTILYPTDFSDRSLYAFRMACALARDYGARVIVLHVVEPPFVPGEPGAIIDLPANEPNLLMDRLKTFEPHDPSVKVEHVMREGPAAEVIADAAKEAQADLIVMGTHGRTGLSRILLGSVTEQVLRHAECPVLTVRAPLSAAFSDASEGAKEPSAKS